MERLERIAVLWGQASIVILAVLVPFGQLRAACKKGKQLRQQGK